MHWISRLPGLEKLEVCQGVKGLKDGRAATTIHSHPSAPGQGAAGVAGGATRGNKQDEQERQRAGSGHQERLRPSPDIQQQPLLPPHIVRSGLASIPVTTA